MKTRSQIAKLSVKLVRLIDYVEFSVYDRSQLSLSSERHGVRRARFIELTSGPWPTGSRIRSKRFRDVKALQFYLNKLLFGGWVSESDYNDLFELSLEIEAEQESVV